MTQFPTFDEPVAIDPELVASGIVRGTGIKHDLELKMWVLVRLDTGMTLGKAIAQGGHGFVTGYALTALQNPNKANTWFNAGQPKITKKVKNLAQLQKCFALCREAGLVTCLVEDEGRTEFGGVKTLTAVGVGPCFIEELPKAVKDLQNIILPIAEKSDASSV